MQNDSFYDEPEFSNLLCCLFVFVFSIFGRLLLAKGHKLNHFAFIYLLHFMKLNLKQNISEFFIFGLFI